MKSNIYDTALIFEGGGMRASYTAGFVNMLLEQELYFDNVYGLSAGSSNAVNYLSRDMRRAKESFVGIVAMEQFGDAGTFLRHKGLFNARKIYEEACAPGAFLPFDFDAFKDNPAKLTIESFQRDTGKSVYWTKDDMHVLEDLMVRVRASSTLPLAMPSPIVEGQRYYDGGLGEGAGFLLPKAQDDGFKRFVVVRTRPKAYRKESPHGVLPALMNLVFWRRPHVRRRLTERWHEYNAMCEEIERLEEAGSAFVFYAEEMAVESGTKDLAALEASYQSGWSQAHRQLPRLIEFLEC